MTETMESPAETVGPGYFFARIGAHILDLFVCFGIFYAVGMAVAARYGGLGGHGQFNVQGLPALIILGSVCVAGFLYFVLTEALMGRTFGKMACGLKVVKEEGGCPGLGPVIIRNLLRVADAFFFYVVGLVFMLTSKTQQRIGDRLAKTRVVSSPSAGLQALGALLLIACVGGAVWGAIRIQKSAELNAKMEILNARYLAAEEGPPVVKNYTMGDDIYLVFDVANIPVNDQGQMDTMVQFQAMDPAGHAIVEPVDLPVNGPGPKSLGDTTPLRFHLTLPIYAVGGEHVIQITAKDRIKNRDASLKVPFTVDGPKVPPNSGFSVQDHAFLSGAGSEPLKNATYAPGEKIRTRFNVLGFQIGPEQAVKMRMDLGVVSEAGLKLLDQPGVVNITQKFFYAPVYLPITASVDTPPDVQTGKYKIQYVLHDDVAGTQISLEVPFVISPQSP